jgi:glycosyltransferase involved in cell wall biosynthesis
VRILLVNKFVRVTGGADLHCLWLAAALRDRGHEVRFVSTVDESNLDHEGVFVAPTVTHATRNSMPLLSQGSVATNAVWNREAARATRQVVSDWRPDVVHAHKLYPQLSVAPVVEAARNGVPIVQTLHDFELVSAGALDARGGWRDTDEPRASYRLLNTATLPVRRHVHIRRIASFIAVSRFVARVYSAHGIEASVLPNFVVRPAGFTVVRPEARNGIAFVGRLTIDKGIRDVLLLASALPNIPITIVGAGTLEKEVRSRASALPNVTFTGFLAPAEAARIVASARIVVLPSLCHDAAPLVAVEAMSAGTPVVAYASGGLAEYVADAGCGLVVQRDPVSLTAACERLLADTTAWSTMSAHGLEAANTTHSPERYVERIEELYESLAPSRDRVSP